MEVNDSPQPGATTPEAHTPSPAENQPTPPTEHEQQTPSPEGTPPEGSTPEGGEGEQQQARHDDGSAKKQADSDSDRPKSKKRYDARIDALTSELNKHRRAAQYWESQAKKSQGRRDQPLDRLSFKTEEEYLDATVQRAVGKTQDTFAQTQAQTAQQQAVDAQVELFSAREEDFAEQVPDYRDVAYNRDVPYSQPMLNAISTAENGPAIAYYLGKNIREASRIAQLPPLEAAYAIGRLETKIQAPAKAQSKAPPPVPTVKTTTAAPGFKPDSNDPEAYRRWREGLK
jgi:hypothetical protein